MITNLHIEEFIKMMQLNMNINQHLKSQVKIMLVEVQINIK